MQIFTFDKAIASGRQILFPGLEDLGVLPANMARKKLGAEGCPWNPDFEQAWNAWKAGEEVNLAEGGLLRAGVGVSLSTPMGVVLGRFKAHPTVGDSWAPPAGLWGEGTPFEAALNELGQEVIITKNNKVGFWTYDGEKIQEDWVRRYANEHNLEIDENLTVAIKLQKNDQAVSLKFGENDCFQALVGNSFETGGFEFIFAFELVDPDSLNGIELRDGEWLDFSSEWRESEVGFMNDGTINKILRDSVGSAWSKLCTVAVAQGMQIPE
jgi:hypothetical protein